MAGDLWGNFAGLFGPGEVMTFASNGKCTIARLGYGPSRATCTYSQGFVRLLTTWGYTYELEPKAGKLDGYCEPNNGTRVYITLTKQSV